jgi:hypothetical protein
MAITGKRAQAAVANGVNEIVRQMECNGRKGLEMYQDGVAAAQALIDARFNGEANGQIEYHRHTAVVKFATSAAAYGFACAYAISLGYMLEAVGDTDQYRYTKAQAHYSRAHGDAERCIYDLTNQAGFSRLSRAEAKPYMDNPQEREMVERQQREAEGRATMADRFAATRSAIEAQYR